MVLITHALPFLWTLPGTSPRESSLWSLCPDPLTIYFLQAPVAGKGCPRQKEQVQGAPLPVYVFFLLNRGPEWNPSSWGLLRIQSRSPPPLVATHCHRHQASDPGDPEDLTIESVSSPLWSDSSSSRVLSGEGDLKDCGQFMRDV